MFVLTSIKQTVRVPSHCFRLDLDQAIGEELNKKYANKVKVCWFEEK
jgi:DNA-directed RNA polymerase subunit E'/Rpb7